MIKLFNTLTRKKEEFKPIKKGEVGMYTCGPTVYWYQHIGNLRAYLFSDLLKKTLVYNGLKVNHIINVTDVGHLTSDADEGEDKMEKASLKEGKKALEIADFYFKAFLEDLTKLNIEEPKKWTKATEHIDEQIELIKKLEKKGYTYKTSDGIYFDSLKFKDYGKLAKLDIKGLKAGKRVTLGEKKNKTDFALWKFSKKDERRQQEWDSPFGVGFPGWHIECSAMSTKYLGEHFDIHTGGIDHIPIHHTNEIAQSECASNKKFVNYWMHVAFLLFKGEKVSKSKGGLYRLNELIDLGYSPEDFRYLTLLTQYRKSLNFTLENLDSAKNALSRIKSKILDIKEKKVPGRDKSKEYKKQFLESINDDLNTPKAVQIFLKALEDDTFDWQKKIQTLEDFDKVFSLGIKDVKKQKVEIEGEVERMVIEREKLRKEKRWAEADILRERIKERGFKVIDTENGYNIEKI